MYFNPQLAERVAAATVRSAIRPFAERRDALTRDCTDIRVLEWLFRPVLPSSDLCEARCPFAVC
jgi:hypothetical protein